MEYSSVSKIFINEILVNETVNFIQLSDNSLNYSRNYENVYFV